MDTDALIEALARDAAPVSRHAVARRLAAGIAAGSLASVLLLVAILGTASDLGRAIATRGFWASEALALSASAAGTFAAAKLARPETTLPKPTWILTLPLAAVVASAAAQAACGRMEGTVWMTAAEIVMLAAPILAGIVVALRKLAPTCLAAAGAAAGLASGGVAAALYGLNGLDQPTAHLLVRDSVAIALSSAIGALLGPRLLRW
ncbi:MAG TPA: NrsF family protein [Allosphingosinicella sp.]|jgi:hypothetical protein